MTKDNQNFTMRAGDSILIKNSVTESDGTNRDVTGDSATFVLSDYAGADAVVSYSDSDSNVSMGPTQNHVIEVELLSSDTQTLGGVNDGEQYFYQIILTDQNNKNYTVTEGTITIKPSQY